MKNSLIIGITIVIILAIVSGIYWYSHSPKEESSTTCIKAGEVYQSPAVLGKIRGECCNNITTIAQYTLQEVNCELFQQEVGGNFICSDCGNNICENDWENKCNCPEDCNQSECRQEGEFYSLAPMPDGSEVDRRPCCQGLINPVLTIADVKLCIACGDHICKNYTSDGNPAFSETTLCPSDCK